MERNFYDDEFEDFLKERADQYKLYPSDRAWTGIYNFLHVKRKWHTITGTLLLLTILVFISLEIDSSGNNKRNKLPSTSLSTVSAASKNTHLNLPPTTIAALDHRSTNTSYIQSTATSPNPYKINTNSILEMPGSFIISTKLPIDIARPIVKDDNTDMSSGNKLLPQEPAKKENRTNWLQEIAATKISLKKDKRFKLQYYFSPTSSYRKLQNNKDAGNTKSVQVSPLSGDPINVDGIVNHQPAIGLEVGSSLLFNISKNLALKAGAQLNFVRYNIKAYKSYPERTAITLSSVVNSYDRETITSYSSIRNVGGRSPEDLQNQYLQISLPIGAELKVLGNKKLQLHVAGTVQPTYLLYKNSYVLSSNYTNYTKDPGLVRRWNANAAIETYLSYNTGEIRWQVGPQFRYQLLSTYSDRYPIRENLMEYGIKIGVSKPIK